MARGKVFFLICLSHLFSTYVPLSERSVKGSPISALFPLDQFFMPHSEDKVPEVFAHRLEHGWHPCSVKAAFTMGEVEECSSFIAKQFIDVYNSSDYYQIPQLLISLKPQIHQLNAFLSESQKLTKDEKEDKYQAIRPTLDQIISKVNEAIQEAVKETVYSSDDIEAAYAKLLQLGDVLDLVSNELSREVNFDSQMLQSDGRKALYSTLIELRNALARDEDPMPALVEVRSNLGIVYRLSFPDYERARTEAYYVLKLVRKKMGWNENNVDEAIEDAKRLIEELYQIKINNWKDIIPELPWTHIKGIRTQIREVDRAKNKRLIPNEPHSSIDLNYKQGKLETFNLEKSLKLEWIRLCEIFETVYEQKPTEKSEELYRLLFALGEFELIYQSRQFLFFPWFDPVTYTRRCRRLHTGLHFFKSALYSPIGKLFGLDMVHSISEYVEDSKKEKIPKVSILNEAALKTFIAVLTRGSATVFFAYSDCNDSYEGLKQVTNIGKHYKQNFLSYFRKAQFEIFSMEKGIATKDELSIINRMENHEIAFMIETLDHRYDIVQLYLLRRALYESDSSSGSDVSTCSGGSSSTTSTDSRTLDSDA